MAFAAKSLAGRFLGHASRRSAAFLPISFLRLHSSDFNPNHSPSPVEVDVVGCGSTLTIDRSGLACNEGHSHVDSRKEAVSAMSNHLNALIRFRGGPITVAEYMEEVLTNPNAGFYMNRDVFGAGGDFVTSPDISQMFGELIGVWSTCLWQQIGRPSKVALVELGPGRGTLMADLLRGTSKFEEFSRAVSVHLVECSPALRSIQEQNLQCVPSEDRAGPKPSGISGAPVSWYLDLDEVPRGVPSIVIAHEFFDALPVHQFQCTPLGWCEKLVDVGLTPSEQFRFVLSPKPTPASALYLTKRLQWVAEEERSQLNHAEVCPRAMSLTETIARRIGHDGGGALIIDYGEDKIISDSLQAISKHKFTNVLETPGTADLSSYVDFAAIRHVATETAAGVSVYGPVTQSQFLGMLGINFRLESLLRSATEQQAEALQLGYWRLVGDGPPSWAEGEDSSEPKPTGMGVAYKALAIVPSSIGAPVGFQ